MRISLSFLSFSLLVVCFTVGCGGGGAPATTVNEEGSRVDPTIDPAFYEDSANLDPLAPAK